MGAIFPLGTDFSVSPPILLAGALALAWVLTKGLERVLWILFILALFGAVWWFLAG